jgi:hypothetical protein
MIEEVTYKLLSNEAKDHSVIGARGVSGLRVTGRRRVMTEASLVVKLVEVLSEVLVVIFVSLLFESVVWESTSPLSSTWG